MKGFASNGVSSFHFPQISIFSRTCYSHFDRNPKTSVTVLSPNWLLPTTTKKHVVLWKEETLHYHDLFIKGFIGLSLQSYLIFSLNLIEMSRKGSSESLKIEVSQNFCNITRNFSKIFQESLKIFSKFS